MNTIAIFLVLTLVTGTLAAVEPAKDAALRLCASLHNVDQADNATRYTNSVCNLECYISGEMFNHNLNEGKRCPNGKSNYICRSGQCVMQQGHIDIKVSSGELSSPANAYVSMCVQNSSAPMTLPISDRSQCITCFTEQSHFGYLPLWNSACEGLSQYLFNADTKISIEVFDHRGEGNNVFIAGNSLTINQLLARGTNHKLFEIPMLRGLGPAKVRLMITWTPTN